MRSHLRAGCGRVQFLSRSPGPSVAGPWRPLSDSFVVHFTWRRTFSTASSRHLETGNTCAESRGSDEHVDGISEDRRRFAHQTIGTLSASFRVRHLDDVASFARARRRPPQRPADPGPGPAFAFGLQLLACDSACASGATSLVQRQYLFGLRAELAHVMRPPLEFLVAAPMGAALPGVAEAERSCRIGCAAPGDAVHVRVVIGVSPYYGGINADGKPISGTTPWAGVRRRRRGRLAMVSDWTNAGSRWRPAIQVDRSARALTEGVSPSTKPRPCPGCDARNFRGEAERVGQHRKGTVPATPVCGRR